MPKKLYSVIIKDVATNHFEQYYSTKPKHRIKKVEDGNGGFIYMRPYALEIEVLDDLFVDIGGKGLSGKLDNNEITWRIKPVAADGSSGSLIVEGSDGNFYEVSVDYQAEIDNDALKQGGMVLPLNFTLIDQNHSAHALIITNYPAFKLNGLFVFTKGKIYQGIYNVSNNVIDWGIIDA